MYFDIFSGPPHPLTLTFTPSQVGQLKGLAHLDLGYNQIKALPEGLASIQAMRILYVNDNLLPYIPNAIVLMLSKLDNFKIEPNPGFDVPEDARKAGLVAVTNYLKKVARS